MALEDHDDESQATPREIELLNRLDALQSQVTELHKARETTENPELLKEVQSLKDQLNEHSKKLEQSAEKLGALEAENLVLRDKNQALNIASNKKCLFRTQVRSIPSLDTPNTAGGTAQQPSGEAGASGEKAGDTRVHETISSDSEMETSEGAASLQSSLTTYLEQMFSKKLDAMQSMVERLPGVAPPIRKSNPGS